MSIVLPSSPKPESKAPEGSHADGFDGEDIVDHQAETASVVKPSLTSTPETSGSATVTSSPDFDETDDASTVNVKDREIWSPAQNGHPVIEEGATVYIPSPEAGSSDPTEIGLERQMELGNIPVVTQMYKDMSVYIDKEETGSDQTRQDPTRQDQTRQDQTRQDQTRQDQIRQDQTPQDTTQKKEEPSRNQTVVRTSGNSTSGFSTSGCSTSGGSTSSREQQSGGLPDIPKDIGLIGVKVSATNPFSETSSKRKSDHEDIEVSVVNRLEGSGMQSYRQELYRDQSRRTSVQVSSIKDHSHAAESLHATRRKSSGDALPLRHRPRKHKVLHTGKTSHLGHHEHTGRSSVSSSGSLENVDSAQVTAHGASREAVTGVNHHQAERSTRHEQIHNSHVTTTAANRYYSVVSGPILKPPSLDRERKQDDDDDDEGRSSMNRVETSSRSPMKSRGPHKDKEHIARREKQDREFLMAKQTMTDTILLTNTNLNTNTNNRSFAVRHTHQMQSESNVAGKENRQSPSGSEEQVELSTHQESESSATIPPNECVAPGSEEDYASTILVKSTVDISLSSDVKSYATNGSEGDDASTGIVKSTMAVSPSSDVKSNSVSKSENQSDCVKEDVETTVSQVLQVDQDQSREELLTTSETVKGHEITTALTGDSPAPPPSLASRLLPLCKVVIHILSRAEQPFYV